MNNSDKFNKWFNIFILTGMTLAMVAATLYKLRSSQTDHALLIVAAFGSLMGVLSTVCSANAKILTFLFGLFDVSIYGVMCYMSGKYGNAALHLLYFLPMQFVAFFRVEPEFLQDLLGGFLLFGQSVIRIVILVVEGRILDEDALERRDLVLPEERGFRTAPEIPEEIREVLFLLNVFFLRFVDFPAAEIEVIEEFLSF